MPRVLQLIIFSLIIYWGASKVGWDGLDLMAEVASFHQIPTSGQLSSFTGESGQVLEEVNNLLVADYRKHRISYIPLERVPVHLRMAFLATEDARFYQHGPVDLRGIARAVFNNLRDQNLGEGGSTITQQLAKNLFLSGEKSFTRKVEEVYLAYQLEKRFTKAQIMEMYLNQIYFGDGVYGVDRASKVLFGVPAAQVSLGQAAMLAGIPKHPNRFWPLINPTQAKIRQGIVLDRMVSLGYITKTEAEDARNVSLHKKVK